MDKGWIKLYRQIQESAIWLSSAPFDRRSAWIDLIMMANVKTKQIVYKGQTLTIKRGQVYTSVRILAERWHWSKDKVSRFLKMLIDLRMISRDFRAHNATLLTIVKYDDFQSQRDSNRDSNKDTRKDSNKDTDKSLLKNVKNDKEIKEDSSPTSIEEAPVEEEFDWDSYPEEGVYDENGKRVF